MAFGCQHVETAGRERLFLEPLDVLANRLFLCLPLGSGFKLGPGGKGSKRG